METRDPRSAGSCFISYSEHNRAWVEVFCGHLAQLGLDVKWAPVLLKAGDEWMRLIEASVAAVDAVVVVTTADAMASPWVQREREAGMLASRIPIYVLPESCEVPPFVETSQQVDVSDRDSYGSRLVGLAKRLRGIPESPSLTRELLDKAQPMQPAPIVSDLPAGPLRATVAALAKKIATEEALWFAISVSCDLDPGIGKWIHAQRPLPLALQSMVVRAARQCSPSEFQHALFLDRLSRYLDAAELAALRDQWQRELLAKPREGDLPNPRSHLDEIIDRWRSEPVRLLGDGTPMPRIVVRVGLGPDANEGGPAGSGRSQDTPGSIDSFLRGGPRQALWEITGEPGSGKTTLLRELIANRAESWGNAGALPFFFAAHEFHSRAGEQFKLLDPYRRAGRAFIVIDGLDEIDAKLRKSIRAEAAAIAKVSGNVAIVSSRDTGFEHYDGWQRLRVLPLSQSSVDALLVNLCGAERAASLNEEFEPHQRLRKLLSNPMTLTVIALLGRMHERLPRQRVEIYDCAIDVLLSGSYAGGRGVPSADLVAKHLANLALDLLRTTISDSFEARRIDELLRKWVPRTDWQDDWPDPQSFRDMVEDRTKLMFATDSLRREWRFIHRTFQEYFAANALRSMEREARIREVTKLREDPRWAEVLVMLCGAVSGEESAELLDVLLDTRGGHRTDLCLRALTETRDGAVDGALADRVLGLQSPEPERRAAILLALPRVVPEPPDVVRGFERYLQIRGGTVEPLDLVVMGRVLDSLDMPAIRRSPQRLFDAFPSCSAETLLEKWDCSWEEAWVGVAPGEYGVGSVEVQRPVTELGQRVVTTEGFRIARFAVTRAQFDLFRPVSKAVKDVDATRDRLPATGVSWFAAVAYCDWLRAKGGDVFAGARLPTEVEWEIAASGGRADDPHRFPWGSLWDTDRVHAGRQAETGPVAVGQHRNGESPFGARQMAGNVYEWTLTRYDRTQYEVAMSPDVWSDAQCYGVPRVIRGGSWRSHPSACRCSARDRMVPSLQHREVGFRIVLPWTGV